MINRREFCGCLSMMILLRIDPLSAQATSPRLYAYVTCGDNQWNLDSLPVDSPATVEAIFEFLSKTFGVKRVYWRGEQDRMWLQYHRIRSAFLRDYFINWLGYLDNELKLNDVAVAAAHRHGMEIYIFDGLFDLGGTADTSGDGMYPYIHEDQLRIEHPEWVPIDRWGERLAPGPIEFCYPEARKALVSRYLNQVTQYKYDGIFFYTYVENHGARYLDEYGFNEPIVKEYELRHGADIRKQSFDKDAWYRLRGEYMTLFVGELHSALASKGKKLSMGIYPPTPNYPEPWDGGRVDIPQGGNVYMDWEGWADKGIIDELFVWWRGDQKALLSQMIQVCKGRSVELTVAANKPFDAGWKPFMEAGVTPVSVWAPGFEVDRVSQEASHAEALNDPDWRWRMQALADVAAGKLIVAAGVVAAFCKDPHVLVRRQAMFALGALQAEAYVGLLENGLMDEESSVRIAAAVALARVNGPDSPQRIVMALSKDDKFQMKLACVEALAAMKERALPAVLQGISNSSPSVREVCARVLTAEAPGCSSTLLTQPDRAGCIPTANAPPGAQEALLSMLRNEKEDVPLFHAFNALAGYRSPEVIAALLRSLRTGSPQVQMWSAQTLAQMTTTMSQEQLKEMLSALTGLFREFGDDSKRSDAAWGWRTVGSAMLACGEPGKQMLDSMRTERRGADQRADRWLAWIAYQVLYVPQAAEKNTLCEEREAVEIHAKYAPPFPGRRSDAV